MDSGVRRVMPSSASARLRSHANALQMHGAAGTSSSPSGPRAEPAAGDGVEAQRKRGIGSSNSTFSSFEQVPKPAYSLTEAATDEYDEEFRFTNCDLSEVLAGVWQRARSPRRRELASAPPLQQGALWLKQAACIHFVHTRASLRYWQEAKTRRPSNG